MQKQRYLLVVVLLLAAATSARADWIENFRIGSWWNGVGDNSAGPYGASPYVGQTFQALAGGAQSLEIAVHPYDPLEPSMRFHLLITTLQPNGNNPGKVLFESPTIAAPSGQLSKIAINLHGVPLTAGQTYAFVLDFFTPGKGGQGGVVMSSNNSGSPDFYPQGTAIFPSFYSSLFDSSGKLYSTSRQDHFNVPWSNAGTYGDLAFRMQFGGAASNGPDATITPIWLDPRDAPEPSSFVLGGTAMLLGCFARRKKGARR
jgi:hypothetical protein